MEITKDTATLKGKEMKIVLEALKITRVVAEGFMTDENNLTEDELHVHFELLELIEKLEGSSYIKNKEWEES